MSSQLGRNEKDEEEDEKKNEAMLYELPNLYFDKCNSPIYRRLILCKPSSSSNQLAKRD